MDGATGPAGTVVVNALTATNVTAQTPAAAGDTLTLDTNQTLVGTAVTHTAGSGDIVLTEAGTYLISYHLTATPAAGTTPPVTTAVQLNNAGAVIPGTISSATLTAANDTATLSGSTVVQVTTPPVTINLVANDTNGAFSNLTVNVTKLD